jgi:hypothetical protein
MPYIKKGDKVVATGGKAFLGCLAVVAIVLALFALWSLVFMILWNFVIADVFNGPTLDFIQSAALVLLLSIIGGFFTGKR